METQDDKFCELYRVASPPAPLQKRGVTTIARLFVENVMAKMIV